MATIEQIRLSIHLQGGAKQVLSFDSKRINYFIEDPKGTQFNSKTGKAIWKKMDDNQRIDAHMRAFEKDFNGFGHKREDIIH